MSGLTDTTTGLTNGTGLYWHVGLDGGAGLNNDSAATVTNGILLEDNVSFLLLEDNTSILLLES